MLENVLITILGSSDAKNHSVRCVEVFQLYKVNLALVDFQFLFLKLDGIGIHFSLTAVVKRKKMGYFYIELF